jgi:hypothetical protein
LRETEHADFLDADGRHIAEISIMHKVGKAAEIRVHKTWVRYVEGIIG